MDRLRGLLVDLRAECVSNREACAALPDEIPGATPHDPSLVERLAHLDTLIRRIDEVLRVQ